MRLPAGSILVSWLALVSAAWPAQAPRPAQAPSTPPPPAVKVGEQAPDFTLPYLAPGEEGKVERKQFRLSDLKGKKTVVLAFFPAAFSPG